MKRQPTDEEITRVLERENVIVFRKKPESRSREEAQQQAPPKLNSTYEQMRPTKKTLPEVNRDKRRLQLGDSKPVFVEKEVRQQDNIQLKYENNELQVENVKLKTRNVVLEREVARMNRALEEDGRNGLKGSRDCSGSLKIAMRNIQKEIEEVKKENVRLKMSVKYTTISELEIQRDAILEESGRLRDLLEETRRLATKSMHVLNLEQKIHQLQEKCNGQAKENVQLKKRLEQKSHIRLGKPKESRKQTKEFIEQETKESYSKERSSRDSGVTRQHIKSAQKYRNSPQCPNCRKLTAQKEQQKEVVIVNKPSYMQENPEINAVRHFLQLRFKAHQLTLDEVTSYLVGKREYLGAKELTDILQAEPFGLLCPPYLSMTLDYLFQGKQCSLPCEEVATAFKKMVKAYELQNQRDIEEMYAEVTELVSNYQKDILKALESKKNGQGTIEENSLRSFLSEIELNPPQIEFIITQIILESKDLGHLNYLALFEVFCVQEGGKFERISSVVQQENEEFEESRTIRVNTREDKQEQYVEDYEEA